jgi:hypothetical protein
MKQNETKPLGRFPAAACWGLARRSLLPSDRWPTNTAAQAYKRPTRLGALAVGRLRGARAAAAVVAPTKVAPTCDGDLRREGALAQTAAGLVVVMAGMDDGRSGLAMGGARG